MLREYEDDDDDAATLLAQLNEPSFHRFIGDRGVRTLADARAYLQDRVRASYVEHGFGMYLVSLGEGIPVGLAGLVRRAGLEHVDLGFALAQRHWGRGYATEAGGAVLTLARERFGLTYVVAITDPDNVASARVLERLGFVEDGRVRLPGESIDLRRFARNL